VPGRSPTADDIKATAARNAGFPRVLFSAAAKLTAFSPARAASAPNLKYTRDMPTAQKSMLLANDSNSNLPVIELAASLNVVCKTLRFAGHPAEIDLGSPPVSNPSTYKRIKTSTDRLLKSHCGIVIATKLPYDNNNFFDSNGSAVIVSFADWVSCRPR